MERRAFIKSSAIASASVGVGLNMFNINKLSAKPIDEQIIGHGDFKYKIHRHWGDLDPKTTPVNNCHEMVVDSKGKLVMVTDEPKNNVIVYDRSGKLVDSFGHRFIGGHGMTLAPEGEEDFLVISDCGYAYNETTKKWINHGGYVAKVRTDGRFLFTLPHPQTVGAYKEGQSYNPTETAVAPNGDIYVADGYGSSYIIQYDRLGRYIRHFGGDDNPNPNYVLKQAHGVCVDLRNPNEPQLIVTSRNENCLKFFTMDGIYKKTVPLPGAFPNRPVIHKNNIYLGVCWSRINGELTPNSGYITILDENDKVVSNPGGTKPKYKNGVLQPQIQSLPVFKHCHDVCVDDDENIYVCQWNADKTYPIKLERV